MKQNLATTDAFLSLVGMFYGIWSTTELALDYSIGHFLNLPYEDTHLLTAGLEFNRKSRLSMALINRSDHPKKSLAIQALKVIQNESLRNVFAHSFIEHGPDSVTFIERSRHGSYNPKRHTFTLPEFNSHVEKIYEASLKFHEALGITEAEFSKFGDAAFKVKTKSTTSPEPPNETA